MPSPPSAPQTFEEVLAHINGESMDEYRARSELNRSLHAEAEKYVDLPAARWPRLVFNWDLRPESQRFALDGMKQDDFVATYPDGFILGRVEFEAFDAKLCRFSRRDGPEELWELGFRSSLSRTIAYLGRGLPITPALIAPYEQSELVIRGGHHRYAAAKAVGVQEFPFYVVPSDRQAIESILSVAWSDA